MNYVNNFQNEELLKKLTCENGDYIERVLPKKFKGKLDKKTGKVIELPRNRLKYAFRSKSLYQHVKAFYDFETMNVKLDYAELKIERKRKKIYKREERFTLYNEN